MDTRVQQAIHHLVRSRIHEIKRLQIRWFGGEPLLCRDPIESLGSVLRSLAEEHHVLWDAQIISNGYLLDRQCATWLLQQGVDKAQITLDGCREDHDGRRCVRGRQPTFEWIVSNLVSWQDLIQPKLRVNVDRRNISGMHRLVDELLVAGISPCAQLHFGMARNFNQLSLGKNELRAPEFRELIHPVYAYAIDRGINVDYGVSLHPKTSVCNATKRNTFHVGPDGTIWKCFPCIGTKRGQCSNVFNASIATPDSLLYESFDPFSYPECRDCRLLPMCMRRCPYEDMSLCVNDTVCDFYREHELVERLELVVATANRNRNVLQFAAFGD